MNSLLGNPTVEFCEKVGTGLIKRPFYALSNLAYIFVGVIILKKGNGERISKLFGYTSILIGLLSFIYDASYTYVAQLLDLLGMFLFVNLLIYLSLKRYTTISTRRLLLVQSLFVLLGWISVIYFKSYAGEFVFGTFILFLLLLEYLLWKSGRATNISLWLKGLGLFILGFIIWLPDAMGIICDPNNYINGRSIFHIITSITIYLLYKYYKDQNYPNYI